MKYILMFCSNAQEDEEWAKLPDEVKVEAYGRIGQWFVTHGDKILSSEELQPPSTATTVNRNNGSTVVTDGPFMEAKETIGGYALVDVPDLDAALELAKSWPGNSAIEVRPIVPH